MPDFYEDLGYQLPDDLGEVKSEGFEYYKHPAGIYRGVFGKLTLKYKDLNGKKCEPDADGARLSHCILALWITEYLGTPTSPAIKPVLSVTPDSINIPVGIEQVAELYFPFMISIDPKWQWSIQQKLEKFTIPNHPEYNLVKVNPNKPTEKATNFKAFPYYYGIPVEFNLEVGKNKGGIYLASIKQIGNERISSELMNKLEEDYLAMLKREQDARNEKKDDFTPPPPPETSFDDLENEFLNG